MTRRFNVIPKKRIVKGTNFTEVTTTRDGQQTVQYWMRKNGESRKSVASGRMEERLLNFQASGGSAVSIEQLKQALQKYDFNYLERTLPCEGHARFITDRMD